MLASRACLQKAWKLLRASGVFLNHGIAVSATYRRKGPSFIDKYVFPDGGLVPLGTTVQTAESCGFEVRNVESLREHYVCTQRHWVRRLEARCGDDKRITGETLYRVWSSTGQRSFAWNSNPHQGC